MWHQHDVQELCRVMFDALEQNWKETDQANLINHLYQGKLKDYVKCLEVRHFPNFLFLVAKIFGLVINRLFSEIKILVSKFRIIPLNKEIGIHYYKFILSMLCPCKISSFGIMQVFNEQPFVCLLIMSTFGLYGQDDADYVKQMLWGLGVL